MKITDEAKVLLQEAIAKENADSIELSIKETENGYGLAMELITKKEDDRVVSVNDIDVVMDAETEMALSTTIFAVEGGELVLQSESSCGGGCGGCHGCGH